MFRQLVSRTARVSIRVAFARPGGQIVSIPFSRNFASSLLVQKKAKKGEKIKGEKVTEEAVYPKDLIDFEKVKEKLQGVVERFSKHCNDAKLGKTNPKVFDHLMVKTDHGDMPYTSVAQTNVKGRNFIMTVYDPANTQHIINAVLGSDLNLNPVADPSNKLTLKVPLPPITTESKKESVKDLKTVYEKLKNGSGLSKIGSLSSIRADTRHKLTKNKKLTDIESSVWNDYEKIHKDYVSKLAALMKAAEEAIMK